MKGQRIGYVRVSSFDQNPERQLEQSQVDKVFTDKASGKDTRRPRLDTLLTFVREGDTVVVHSMDRLARNRYSVPCEWAGQMVSTHLYPAQIVVVAGDAMVATHERLSDRNQTRYDWQHYVPLIERKPGALRNGAPFADLPEPLQRMRKGLLHQEGGDRVMAQVLAEVPKQGLDAVLVAVELALESAPPSGRVSTEHVINVLGRLQAQPLPETVATNLQVSQTPLADTARYDSLRAGSDMQEADHA